MNFSDPRFYLDIAVIVVSVINMLFTWLRKPGQEAIAGVAKVNQRLDEQVQIITVATTSANEELRRSTRDEHEQLRQHFDERHRDTHTDLAILRTHIEHMPTSDELTKLAGSVQALTASQEGFRNTQATMSASLTRIENYLLNQK